ncbi:MAG TPA: hypothetical protein PLK58_00775 [Candidatus Rifleibacterium sp.]|nr:hypothetical protein [Candidatus Rifleibacterium sp.]HPW57143.1 hypothetical protein [Candidatus Rifleibacterium sp.]
MLTRKIALTAAFSLAMTVGLIAEPASAPASVAVPAAIDETVEPSDNFRLVIDGQETRLVPEKPFEITIKGEKMQGLLQVEPLKTFNYGGISLQYPRHFTFEADLSDKDVSLWNLSGSNCVLMIQLYPAEMDHKIMAQMLQPRFGEKNSTVSDCTLSLKGNETKGSKLTTTIGDSSITQEIYSFKVQGGSLLLILQDTLNLDGKSSEEGRKFRQLLIETLSFSASG